MTSPDGRIPSGSASQNGMGLASWAAKTGDQWKNEQTNTFATKYETNFFNKWITNLFGGFIGGIAGFISQFFSGVFGGGSGGGFLDLIGGFLGVKSQASNANTAASAAQTAAAAASAAAAANSLTVQQVRSQIVQLADNIPAINAWESRVPGQQVSFPMCLLNETLKTLQLTTGSTTAGSGSHNHTQRGSTNPGYTPVLNAVEGVWIQARYSAGRATASFFIGPGSSSSPSLYVYFGRMTETGDLVIEYVSPDQKPIITTQLQLVNVTAPTDVLFDFGEWMFVGIHQQGSGFPRVLYCNEMTPLPLDPDAFPRQDKMHFNSTSVLAKGSTLPKASQLYSSPYVPWVGFGVRLRTGDPLPRSWYDPFDEDMFNRWTGITYAGIFTVSRTDRNTAGFFGTTNGTQRAIYNERVAYDDIIGEWSPLAASAQVQTFIYHANSTCTTYMAIEQTSTTTTICRFVSGTRTALATTPDTPSGAAYRITVGLNEDEKEVHVVEKKASGATEWAPVVPYTESTPGALGTRGAGFRYGGLECRRGGFAVNSGEFDYFAIRDNVILEESAA